MNRNIMVIIDMYKLIYMSKNCMLIIKSNEVM